jgi:hypothetical protein
MSTKPLRALLTGGCRSLVQVPADVADHYPLRSPRTGLVDFHNHAVLKPYS